MASVRAETRRGDDGAAEGDRIMIMMMMRRIARKRKRKKGPRQG